MKLKLDDNELVDTALIKLVGGGTIDILMSDRLTDQIREDECLLAVGEDESGDPIFERMQFEAVVLLAELTPGRFYKVIMDKALCKDMLKNCKELKLH